VPVLVLGALVSGCRPAADAPPGASALASDRHGDIGLPLETLTIEARVAPNATLEALFRQHEVRQEEVTAAIAAIREVFRPRNLLRVDQPYRLVRTLDGMLRSFEYRIDADRFLRVLSPEDGAPSSFTADVIEYEKTTELTALRAEIDASRSSLIAAIDAEGERVQLAIAVAELFAGDVDFESDLQPGDSLELLYERVLREGEFARYGAILAARLQNGRRDLQAYRFVQNGRADYFDEEGRSIRRPFLRSPLRFTPRVTSGFSHRRLHPVHRVYRPHLGVDYGAPHGSPVVAVASGSVVSAGRSGAAGLMVRLRHNNGFESYYLHLSALGKGIRAGARVDQGQLIGRVGATGTATGPHLDYRLRRNGVFVNPLTVHRNMPPGDPIAASLRPAFLAERERVLQLMSTTLLAQADAAPRAVVKAAQ
jgi:murein DD-endopeptidase MepM/ murein hydrolase activator NlpD